MKKLLNTTRNKKRKHDKILLLAKSKIDSIETLIYQALTDMDISLEVFVIILKEEDKYEKMKDNLRSNNEKSEIMRLSSVKSKIQMKKYLVFYVIKKRIFFFLCMHKMVEISAETWNKAEVAVMNIHENDNVNKTLFKLLCNSDVK